jgi:hypothetical protein
MFNYKERDEYATSLIYLVDMLRIDYEYDTAAALLRAEAERAPTVV